MHYSDLFFPYGYTNGKWMRVHQWQPDKKRFFINNVAFYINEVDKEETPFHYTSTYSHNYTFGRRIDLYFSKERCTYVKNRLDEIFRDKDFIYVTKRAPQKLKVKIEPIVDFFDNLFMDLGSSVTWSATRREQIQHITRTTIFPSHVIGKDPKEYFEWWLMKVGQMVFSSKILEAEPEKEIEVEFEIELFNPFIFDSLNFVNEILTRVFSDIHKREGYRLETELYKGAPKAKYYKRHSLILRVKVIKE